MFTQPTRKGCSFKRPADHLIIVSSFCILIQRKLHGCNYPRAVCSNHLQNCMSPLHHCLCLQAHCPCCQRGKPLLTLWGLVCTKHTHKKNLWLRWWFFFFLYILSVKASSKLRHGWLQTVKTIHRTGCYGEKQWKPFSRRRSKVWVWLIKEGSVFYKN